MDTFLCSIEKKKETTKQTNKPTKKNDTVGGGGLLLSGGQQGRHLLVPEAAGVGAVLGVEGQPRSDAVQPLLAGAQRRPRRRDAVRDARRRHAEVEKPKEKPTVMSAKWIHSMVTVFRKYQFTFMMNSLTDHATFLTLIFLNVTTKGVRSRARLLPGLGEVGQQGHEDVAAELEVGGRHGHVLAPQVAEDVLQVVAVGHAQVGVLALQVDDAVLAAVLEQVAVRRHAVIGQQARVPVRAARVQ